MDIERKVLYGLASEAEMDSLGGDVFKIKSRTSSPHRRVTITKSMPSDGSIVLTAESPDRVGDIVTMSGVDTTNFDANPIMLWGHDSENPSSLVGMWETPLRRDSGKTLSRPLFMDAGINPVADMASEMYDGRWVRGASIGFLPRKTREVKDKEEREALGLGRFGVVYEEVELLEASLTPLPMHPGALRRSLIEAIGKTYSEAVIEQALADVLPLDPISKQLEEIRGLLTELLRAAAPQEPNGTKRVTANAGGESRSANPAAYMRQLLEGALDAARSTK